MKTILSLLLALFILIPSHGSGEPAKNPLAPKNTAELSGTQQAAADTLEDKGKVQAEQKVRNQPSRHAKTVDLYINRMASIPGGSDLGWQVHRVEDGYEVIREIQNGLKVFTFKWGVSESGEITPLNKRAQDITKQPEPVPEKPAS